MTPVIRAFLRAASDGDVNLVRSLLAQGTDVNSSNRSGQTALMLAVGFGRREVIDLLIKAGARVELQDELGLSAIDWANDDEEIIGQLKSPSQIVNNDPTLDEERSPEILVKPVTITQPASMPRSTEEPTLKGLAGAILRDHKPRLEEHVRSIPAPAEPMDIVREKIEEKPVTFDDETLDRPRKELTEDTVAPISRGRIFDVRPISEAPRPVSKVEVTVPASPRKRSYTLVWLFLLLAAAAVLFLSYRYGRTLLTAQSKQSTTEAQPTTPLVQPNQIVKSPPIVSGELAGAELHLPDAEYPSQAKDQSGAVKVQVQASRKGIVFAARAIDGDEIFRAPAETAAKGSAFLPEKLAGKGDTIEGTITYTFVPGSLANKSLPPGVSVVAGGPLSGSELQMIKPEYPVAVKHEGKSEDFTIVVRVNRAGKVMSWRPLSGDDRLRQSVIQAAKRSTFAPAKLPGRGEVVGTITYTFN
ncbi:MAG TPA: ankyrin repeat domain-containing protein [Pyrinomonadaceae bacterium]